MQCNYCSGEKYLANEDIDDDGHLSIEIEGRRLATNYFKVGYSNTISKEIHIVIQYCPVCGRKL